MQRVSVRLYQPIIPISPESNPFVFDDRSQLLNRNPSPRLSAVMILIYNKNNLPYFSLIERSQYDGVHSGQIALPGGAKDISDKDLETTALRELKEEIGIDNNINILGKLSEVYISPSKFLVTPFVGMISINPSFIKDDFEVEKIIEVPMSMLFDEKILKHGPVTTANNLEIDMPYFDIYGHIVWGATAIILNEFKTIMKT